MNHIKTPYNKNYKQKQGYFIKGIKLNKNVQSIVEYNTPLIQNSIYTNAFSST